ncbi:MAG: hypothetical protein ACK56I_23530, partial [bacterium]
MQAVRRSVPVVVVVAVADEEAGVAVGQVQHVPVGEGVLRQRGVEHVHPGDARGGRRHREAEVVPAGPAALQEDQQPVAAPVAEGRAVRVAAEAGGPGGRVEGEGGGVAVDLLVGDHGLATVARARVFWGGGVGASPLRVGPAGGPEQQGRPQGPGEAHGQRSD